MAKIYDDSFAFPFQGSELKGMDSIKEGLTIRQLFAGLALPGYLANYAGSNHDPDPKIAAEKVVEYTDALINQLNK